MNNENKELDVIEKTVEDLKKRIEEVNTEGIETELVKDKAQEVKGKTINSLKDMLAQLKKKLSDVQDSERVSDILQSAKENVIIVFDEGKTKLDELINNDKVRNTIDDAKEGTKEIGQKLNDEFGKIVDREEVQKVINKVSEGTGKVSKVASELVERAEVSEKIEKAKDITVDFTDKAAKKIRDWLRPEEKDVNQDEENNDI